MREIIELEGAEYLAQTYKFAQAYKDYLKETGASDVIFRPAELTGKETKEELAKKTAEQGAKNAADMVKLLYEEKAAKTEKILPLFVVLDKGEKTPPTRKLAAAMAHALQNSDFMDFLVSLM